MRTVLTTLLIIAFGACGSIEPTTEEMKAMLSGGELTDNVASAEVNEPADPPAVSIRDAQVSGSGQGPMCPIFEGTISWQPNDSCFYAGSGCLVPAFDIPFGATLNPDGSFSMSGDGLSSDANLDVGVDSFDIEGQASIGGETYTFNVQDDPANSIGSGGIGVDYPGSNQESQSEPLDGPAGVVFDGGVITAALIDTNGNFVITLVFVGYGPC